MRLLWNVDNTWVLHVWLLVVTEEPTVYGLKLYNNISNYFKNTFKDMFKECICFVLLFFFSWKPRLNLWAACQAVNQSVSQ